VAPVLAVAAAVIVVAVFTATDDETAGELIDTVGAAPLTVTVTADDVVVTLPVWVATAVRLTKPADAGVQTTE
jgi:hypothetical protein